MTGFGLRGWCGRGAAVGAVVAALATTGAAAATRAPVRWRGAVTIDSAPLTAVACPSARLCVATDGAGAILTATNPPGSARDWHRTAATASTAALTALACPSARLCLAATSTGELLVSTRPASGPWTSLPVDPASGLTALACPSTRLCLAADASGDVLVSHQPAGGASAWTLTHIDSAITYACRLSRATGTACQVGLLALACPSTRLCVATDSGGYVLISHEPAGSASTWRALGHPKPVGFGAVSCPTRTLCLLSGGFDGDIAALDPTHPRTLRTVATPEGGSASLAGVACASTTLCFAADQAGGLFTSTHPTGPAATWPLVPIRHGGVVSGIACRPTWCLAVDEAGAVAVGRRTARP